MANQFAFPLNVQLAGIVHAAAGGNVAGAAPHILSLKGAHKAYIVASITQGNAAQTVLTPKQASSVTGATKAVSANCRIWACLDFATSDALVEATAGVAYVLDVGLKKKVVVIEIDPLVALDLANGYDCITLDTSASDVTNIVAALLFIVPRYAPGLSAIAD